MASHGKAVTGTAVMARSANEEKKKKMCIQANDCSYAVMVRNIWERTVVISN